MAEPEKLPEDELDPAAASASRAGAAASDLAKSDPENPLDPEVTGSGLVGFILAPALLAAIAVAIVYGFYIMTYDRRTFQDYSTLLRSENKTDRWKAALDLVDTNRGSPELVPILIEMIDAQPEDQDFLSRGWEPGNMLKTAEEQKVNLRWFATAALAKIGGPEAYQKLLALSSDRDDGVRMFAAQGLGHMRIPEARAQLERLLAEDPDFGVRTAAAFALGELADPAATPALKKAYDSDANEDTRLHAAIALARMGDASGRTLLEEKSKSDNIPLRQEARKALRLLDAPKN